jgi:hypothetical protein
VSAAEIEYCGRDVRSWVRDKLNPQGFGPRLGYNGAVKLAIYSFHKTGDRIYARAHLRDLLDRFSNVALKSSAEAALESYLIWYDRQQPVVAGYRVRLQFPVTDEVVLGGEVSRVDADLSRGGYRAVLLAEAPPGWRTELRMPLIQLATARLFQRPPAEFRVGFQNVDGTQLALVTFDDDELAFAEERARDIARRLAAEWVRQGGAL